MCRLIHFHIITQTKASQKLVIDALKKLKRAHIVPPRPNSTKQHKNLFQPGSTVQQASISIVNHL